MAYDIRMVKLVNGDLVIGKWDEGERKINDPAMIQALPTQQGGIQMMILPFGYPFEAEITGSIGFEHILYEYKKTPEELKTKYLEASSNLTLSTARDLKTLQRMSGGAAKPGKVGDISSLIK
jgi:hypothetical protein